MNNVYWHNSIFWKFYENHNEINFIVYVIAVVCMKHFHDTKEQSMQCIPFLILKSET